MLAITGANGQLGHLVIDSLLRRSTPFRALSRDPAAVAKRAPGVDARRGDFDDPASLIEALDGVGTLLLISTPDPNELRIRRQRAAIDAAVRAAVRRVVYLSFLVVDPASPFPFAASHAATEEHLRASGLQWTILRPSLYLDALGMIVPDIRAHRRVQVPAGAGRASFLSRADIAEAAVAALLDASHAGRTIPLTGAEALSYADLAALASGIVGAPVTYTALDEATYRDRAAAALGPMLEPFVAIWRTIAGDWFAPVTADAATLLGRPPTSAADFLRAALA